MTPTQKSYGKVNPFLLAHSIDPTLHFEEFHKVSKKRFYNIVAKAFLENFIDFVKIANDAEMLLLSAVYFP